MKKIIRITALALLAVMMLAALTSCAKTVSGSYQAEVELLGQGWDVTYTFKGNKVEAVSKFTLLGMVESKEAVGTYEITENPDGSMDIYFDFEEETALFKDGRVTFAEGEDYIKLGGVKYSKLGE